MGSIFLYFKNCICFVQKIAWNISESFLSKLLNLYIVGMLLKWLVVQIHSPQHLSAVETTSCRLSRYNNLTVCLMYGADVLTSFQFFWILMWFFSFICFKLPLHL